MKSLESVEKLFFYVYALSIVRRMCDFLWNKCLPTVPVYFRSKSGQAAT